MAADYQLLAVPGVRGLRPYQPGKPIEEVQRELGLAEVVKLASNENPLGPSPRALEAIAAALPELTLYPDASGYRLKRAISDKFGLAPEQLVLGNGSNDVLELLARVFLSPETSAVYSEYAFVVYPLAVQALGANAIVVPAKDWGHDLEGMAAAIRPDTRLVFVANPNNPTGTWANRQQLTAFLDRVPEEAVVVLDEAYVEYVTEPDYPNGLELLARYPNLVVCRTFSKAYGLAGLRVGFAACNPQIADLLNRVRQPFNVNSLALAAAEAALGDDDYLRRSRELNAAGMVQLEAGLRQRGLDFIPSVGNFLCVHFGRDVMPIYQALLRQGVIVRPIGVYGMPHHLRVSVGLERENARFLEVLDAVLAP